MSIALSLDRIPTPRPIEEALSPIPSPPPPEVNENGKRTLETNPVEALLTTYFYTEQDIRNLQIKLNESRTSDGVFQSRASFEVAPQVMYTGIRSYDQLARMTYNTLTEMCMIPGEDTSDVDPMNDDFFVALEACIKRNLGKLEITPEAFEASLSDALERSYEQRPNSSSRRYFFSLYLSVFLANTRDIYGDQAYANFATVALEASLRISRPLFTLKKEIESWLTTNGYDLRTFYDNIIAKAEIIQRQTFLDLTNPQIIFRLFRDIFTQTVQSEDVDLDAEFFEFTQNVYFNLKQIPPSLAREGVKALLAENFQKLLHGSRFLERKYQPIVEWFLKGLDITEGEITATSCIEVPNSEEFIECLKKQLANLRNVQINFKNFAEKFKEDLDQFHSQRLGSRKVAEAFTDFTAPYEIKVANFPFLCRDEVVSFASTEPGAEKMAKILRNFYSNVYSEIHDSHMSYLTKNITAVVNASITLEGIVDRYEKLLTQAQNNGAEKKQVI